MTKTLKVAKGIKGIRKFINETAPVKTGWHIVHGSEYMTFNESESAYDIIERKSLAGLTFIGWTGNMLFFTKED